MAAMTQASGAAAPTGAQQSPNQQAAALFLPTSGSLGVSVPPVGSLLDVQS